MSFNCEICLRNRVVFIRILASYIRTYSVWSMHIYIYNIHMSSGQHIKCKKPVRTYVSCTY